MTRAVPLPGSALPAGSFRYRRTIRFGECDPAGIVYYPRFVEMLHDAMEAWVRAPAEAGGLGLDYHAMIKAGTGFPTARLEVDFLAPATMGEELSLTPRIQRIGSASLELVVHAHRGETEVFRGRLVIVTVSVAETRPVPLPASFRAALERQVEDAS
jgi:4-hydroxybenzoyl-CoA thioesterase